MTRPTACSTTQWMRRCQRAVSCRAAFVMPQQPAERLVTDDVVQAERTTGDRFRRRQTGIAEGHVAERLMRPKAVIIGKPTRDNVPQVILAEDKEVIEHLMLGPLHPRLGERIHVGRARRDGSELDTVGFQDRAELGGELRVPVADNVKPNTSTARQSTPRGKPPSSIPTAQTRFRKTAPPNSGRSPPAPTTRQPPTTAWAGPRPRPTSGAWSTHTRSTPPAVWPMIE